MICLIEGGIMISFTTVAVFEFVHVLAFLLLGDIVFFGEPGIWLAYNIAMAIYVCILIFLVIINRGDEPEISPVPSIASMDKALFEFSRDNKGTYLTIYVVLFVSMLGLGKFVIRAGGLHL